QNAITYSEIWPLIAGGEMWLGTISHHTLDFAVPERYTTPERAEPDQHGRRIVKDPAICWFNHLEIARRDEDIPLYQRYADDPAAYPTYDNFEAIEVSKVKDIPKDYDGLMGVPITFLGKHNPDQFETVGSFNAGGAGKDLGARDTPTMIQGAEK